MLFKRRAEIDNRHHLISTQFVSEDRVPFCTIQEENQKEIRGLDRRKQETRVSGSRRKQSKKKGDNRNGVYIAQERGS